MIDKRALASVMLLALALLLAAPGMTLAADEKPDILSPRFDLTIWTIVVFALLYVVLRFVKLPGAPAPAWVAMLDGLKKREESIRSALDEAEKARAETARLVAQFEADRK